MKRFVDIENKIEQFIDDYYSKYNRGFSDGCQPKQANENKTKWKSVPDSIHLMQRPADIIANQDQEQIKSVSSSFEPLTKSYRSDATDANCLHSTQIKGLLFIFFLLFFVLRAFER